MVYQKLFSYFAGIELTAEVGHNGWQNVSENMTSEKIGERIWKSSHVLESN